ncbi:hypothetical protein Bca52824_003828 [Brassica carinata]|uniref:Uncharacterized protein n=1 Tax=Brassica carinata TaxID=52824 RepID=A0A8X8BFL2_BRACI|nr:hypothetical protein Bca52824_003828 [Brassica carinata]
MVGLMAFDHAFYYDEYGVYQTDIDLSSSQMRSNKYSHIHCFLDSFAILEIQPVNDIVYFPKWYLKGLRTSSIQTALKMPEPELVGLDSVAQDFFPIPCVAFTTMVHVNWKRLDGLKHSNISYSDIDKLSLSNIPNGSDR